MLLPAPPSAVPNIPSLFTNSLSPSCGVAPLHILRFLPSGQCLLDQSDSGNQGVPFEHHNFLKEHAEGALPYPGQWLQNLRNQYLSVWRNMFLELGHVHNWVDQGWLWKIPCLEERLLLGGGFFALRGMCPPCKSHLDVHGYVCTAGETIWICVQRGCWRSCTMLWRFYCLNLWKVHYLRSQRCNDISLHMQRSLFLRRSCCSF